MNRVLNTCGRVVVLKRHAVSPALDRADSKTQQQLENYQILRALAMNGDLEAFSAICALDFERTPEAFDKSVATLGKAWLQRTGAL